MKYAKLLSATALVAALSLPAMADTVNATAGANLDASVGISLDDAANAALDASLGAKVAAGGSTDANASGGASVDANASAGADVSATAMTDAAAQASTEAAAKVTDASVMSADDKMIGSVESAEVMADGNVKLIVDLSDDVQTQVTKFSIVVSADVAAKGDLKLKWTEAELASSLDAKAKAAASNG